MAPVIPVMARNQTPGRMGRRRPDGRPQTADLAGPKKEDTKGTGTGVVQGLPGSNLVSFNATLQTRPWLASLPCFPAFPAILSSLPSLSPYPSSLRSRPASDYCKQLCLAHPLPNSLTLSTVNPQLVMTPASRLQVRRLLAATAAAAACGPARQHHGSLASPLGRPRSPQSLPTRIRSSQSAARIGSGT